MIQIGDTLYRRFRYQSARVNAWEAVLVVGETSRSWLYEPAPDEHPGRNRIDKKTLLSARDWRGERDQFYTHDGKEAYEFCRHHAARISHAVSTCRDVDKLRAIADIVGEDLT